MSNDTQKIRLDLRARLEQTEREQEQQPTIERASLVRWLKSKLSFYESEWHQAYKQANEPK
jgi:hypothetical protein